MASGWVAGVAYLGTIYSTQAHMINDRPLAGVLILLALLASTAHWKGAFLAAACHMSPFSMLALPLVGLQLYDHDRLTPSQVARVALGGLVVGIIPYLIVLAMFGFESATNAVLWTVGAGPGSVPRATHGTIFVDPMGWMFTLARNTVRTQPILTVGIACALIVIPSMDSPRYRILASGTALFSLPLLVWSYIGYSIFPLLFLSGFVGISVAYVKKSH